MIENIADRFPKRTSENYLRVNVTKPKLESHQASSLFATQRLLLFLLLVFCFPEANLGQVLCHSGTVLTF